MLRWSCVLLAKPRCGIVGLPNVGKSTVFNALTRTSGAVTGNQPFVTIDPNMGHATVVDSRLDMLQKVDGHLSAKKMPSTVDLWDIAGLVKGAGQGEGLGNKFLSHIRECNAIMHMVRCYENDQIMHMEGKIDPLSDIMIINNELAIADLQSIGRQGGKQAKGKDPKQTAIKKEILARCEEVLLNEHTLSSVKGEFTAEEWEFVESCNFLTSKKMIYVCNVDEEAAAGGGWNQYSEAVKNTHGETNKVCTISASIEQEAAHMGSEGSELLEEFGILKNQAEGVTLAILEALDLKVFFTAGPIEVRSWLCNSTDTVRAASGVIHSEFPERVKKVDVTPHHEYVESNGTAAVKSVQPSHVAADGDVLYFHIDQDMKIRK